MFDVENAAARFVDEYLQREVEYIDVIEFLEEEFEEEGHAITTAVYAEVAKVLENVREGWLDRP